MEALGISPGYLLTFAFSFGILFVVLRAWVYRPLLGMLEKRREMIAKGLEDARIAGEARANAEKEAARIIEEAQAKSAEMIRDATERAALAEKEIRQQAESEVAKAREEALVEVQGERNRMLGEVRGQIISLAIAAARKLIQENLDEKRQRTLLEEFYSGVRSGQVKSLNGLPPHGSKLAEVTSALPLRIEEQAMIRSQVLCLDGEDVVVTFHVDPSILGGLVIRLGDQVIDASMAGQLEDLRQVMQ